jgi:hypothetical protein
VVELVQHLLSKHETLRSNQKKRKKKKKRKWALGVESEYSRSFVPLIFIESLATF